MNDDTLDDDDGIAILLKMTGRCLPDRLRGLGQKAPRPEHEGVGDSVGVIGSPGPGLSLDQFAYAVFGRSGCPICRG
jgi:hypothetical protein